MLGSEWGSWPGGKRISAWERAGQQTVTVAPCIPLFCIFFLSVLLLLLASFAVLFNHPYPDPRVLPLSFHSHHPSGGRDDRETTWSLVAGQSQTTTVNNLEPASSQWCPVKRTSGNVQNLKDLKFYLNIRKMFFLVKVLKNCQRLSRGAVESPSLNKLKPAWNTPRATCFCQPCSEHGVAPDDLQRCQPTSATLQFCEALNKAALSHPFVHCL